MVLFFIVTWILLSGCGSRYLLDAPGLEKIRNPNNIRGISQPMWADFPDTITFIGTQDGIKYLLYELDLGKNQIRVLLPDHTVAHYVWSSDRSLIALWAHNLKSGFDGVSIYNKSDDSFRQLEQDLGIPYSWSPDKTKLAINGACENPKHACSFIYDIAKSQRISLKVHGGTEILTNPSWSPSRDKIAFVLGDPFLDIDVYGLYVMDIGGNRISKLLGVKESGDRISHPTWTEGGEWVVFIYEKPNEKSQISFINLFSKSECLKQPLSIITEIESFDFLEIDGNMHFVILDEHQNLYVLNLLEAIRPLDLSLVLQCP